MIFLDGLSENRELERVSRPQEEARGLEVTTEEISSKVDENGCDVENKNVEPGTEERDGQDKGRTVPRSSQERSFEVAEQNISSQQEEENPPVLVRLFLY